MTTSHPIQNRLTIRHHIVCVVKINTWHSNQPRKSIFRVLNLSQVRPSIKQQQALKTETTCSFETSVDFHGNTRRYLPEDRTLRNHRYDNLRSYEARPCFLSPSKKIHVEYTKRDPNGFIICTSLLLHCSTNDPIADAIQSEILTAPLYKIQMTQTSKIIYGSWNSYP
jgi:hypothetical protein